MGGKPYSDKYIILSEQRGLHVDMSCVPWYQNHGEAGAWRVWVTVVQPIRQMRREVEKLLSNKMMLMSSSLSL